VDTASCPLCGVEERAVDLATSAKLQGAIPAYDLDAPNVRVFAVGGRALLHHACRSPQADSDTRWWTEGQSWWACQQPGRQIDEDALFDRSCRDCLVRWADKY